MKHKVYVFYIYYMAYQLFYTNFGYNGISKLMQIYVLLYI